MGMSNVSEPVTYDKVPWGEVTAWRGEQVHATDGEIGRVQGLVIDPRDPRRHACAPPRGTPLGRKEVAIPIGAVIAADRSRPNITKQEAQDLPAMDVDHSTG